MAAMTIQDSRFANYKFLRKTFDSRPDQVGLPRHGALKRFCQSAGVNAQYLSHVENRRKSIGDSLARSLEAGCGRPEGWMDKIHHPDAGGEPPSDFELQLFGLARRANRLATREALIRIIEVAAKEPATT